MLHTAAIRLMQEDSRLIERALGILERWMQAKVLHSRPLLQEWQRILLERDWDLALSKGARGNQLRQASPVSCILPNEQRLAIIRSCKKATLNIEKCLITFSASGELLAEGARLNDEFHRLSGTTTGIRKGVYRFK